MLFIAFFTLLLVVFEFFGAAMVAVFAPDKPLTRKEAVAT